MSSSISVRRFFYKLSNWRRGANSIAAALIKLFSVRGDVVSIRESDAGCSSSGAYSMIYGDCYAVYIYHLGLEMTKKK